MKKISALIAVAGLAAVASAQSYTIETRWVAQTTSAANGGVGTQLANNAVVGKLDSNDIEVTQSGQAAGTVIYAQRFQLQASVSAAQGQLANLGILAVRGRIAASEAALGNPVGGAPGAGGLGDRAPFNFGPATESFRVGGSASVASRVDEIFNFSSDKDGFPQFTWNFADGNGDDINDAPMPSAPAALGAASFTAIYNVLVQVTAGGDRTITVGVIQGDSRGLQAYNSVPNPVLEPDLDNPQRIFNYLALQMAGERTLVDSSFRINVTPAPSSLALIGLGGLVAARRRRA